MADVHKLRIYAQVPEAYASAMQPGLKAELHFAEQPSKAYQAETMRTSNALDPSARTLQVELQLENKGELFPGAYTDVHFKLPSSMETLRLPANTVLFRGGGLEVAAVENHSTIKIKRINQGRDFGTTVEVLTGVDPNDEIVINPPDSIDDGMRYVLCRKP